MSTELVTDAETAKAIAAAIKGVCNLIPGLHDAVHETLSYYVIGPIKFRRRAENIKRELELSEKMIKGMKILDEISTKEAERVFKAASEKDREELQKLWAAMIARLVTGKLPTIRAEWVDIVKKLEIVDVGILVILPNFKYSCIPVDQNVPREDFQLIPQVVASAQAILNEFKSKWPESTNGLLDIKLALKSLRERNLIEGYPDDAPDAGGMVRSPWLLTELGKKIVEITSAP